MVCYGFKNITNSKNYLKHLRHRENLKVRKMAKRLPLDIPVPTKHIHFHVPSLWKWALLENKKSIPTKKSFYLYNDFYYLIIPTIQNLEILKINEHPQTIKFFTYINNPHSYLFWKNFQHLVYSLNLIFFKKIRFKGKGYYMYKDKRNTITPQFGYAHRIYAFTHSTKVRFLSKTKIVIYGLHETDIVIDSWQIRNMRRMNIFTGRGVRFAKQIVYKKTGKVSAYR